MIFVDKRKRYLKLDECCSYHRVAYRHEVNILVYRCIQRYNPGWNGGNLPGGDDYIRYIPPCHGHAADSGIPANIHGLATFQACILLRYGHALS